MRCKECGSLIPEGMVYCAKCGAEIQIVPDYNPLDDVLAAHVKGSINGEEVSTFTRGVDRSATVNMNMRTNGATVNMRANGATVNMRPHDATVNMRPDNATVNMRRETGRLREEREIEQRRRQAERRRALQKKKKQKRMIVLLVFLALLVGGIITAYQFSYKGIVGKGNKAFANHDYNIATARYEEAMKKKPARPEAYTGLSKIYIMDSKLEEAEEMFLNALDEYSNTALYEAAIQFFKQTEQPGKIAELMDACENAEILEKLKAYVSEIPEFSLPEGTYEDVQELSFKSAEKKIFYTLDGSVPTAASTEYTEPILIGEGETVVTAISVNKGGTPSVPVVRKYLVELPIEDAPAISPSTGQYKQAMKIEINVPNGYTAYYTLDGTNPTQNSAVYNGPIDMPEGNTIFCAVLVNGKGKMSDVTKRNYDLSLE